ncbi:MAG: hypothetical protein COT16_03905 [Elusimicrobia bacterium CG08_land_8_20_14_0_20_44_26]|nr:MAG: hypothetical protein COT16_03905 [Elusimicrobia bacterium CG08_land_8_20_14_0_20_44_26]
MGKIMKFFNRPLSQIPSDSLQISPGPSFSKRGNPFPKVRTAFPKGEMKLPAKKSEEPNNEID